MHWLFLCVSVQQEKSVKPAKHTNEKRKEKEMIKIVVVQLQIIREAIKRTDQVVKSLRNWARAPARMADKRGRFQGSNKKDGVVAVIVDVVAPLPAPAPALTSSISDSEWLRLLSDDFCWLLICPIQFNLFIFLKTEREREREREIWKSTNLREEKTGI